MGPLGLRTQPDESGFLSGKSFALYHSKQRSFDNGF
jgi:hypothetical protein